MRYLICHTCLATRPGASGTCAGQAGQPHPPRAMVCLGEFEPSRRPPVRGRVGDRLPESAARVLADIARLQAGDPAPPVEVGRTYRIEHPSRGTFRATVVEADAVRATVEVAEGYRVRYREDGVPRVCEAGQRMALLHRFCSWTPDDGGGGPADLVECYSPLTGELVARRRDAPPPVRVTVEVVAESAAALRGALEKLTAGLPRVVRGGEVHVAEVDGARAEAHTMEIDNVLAPRGRREPVR